MVKFREHRSIVSQSTKIPVNCRSLQKIMKIDFKKLLPHLIAIVVFWVVAAFFCKPAFEGKVLEQHDIVAVKGMEQNAVEYYQKFGHYPLWNTNLFSGMPNYQVAIQGPDILVNFKGILSLGLPK